MKGSEIYDSVLTRCLELDIDTSRFSELFYSAVLCMAPTPDTTDHDIYRTYIERQAVCLGMVLWCRQPATTSSVAEYSEPGAFLKPLSFYLPKEGEIQNAHIEAYKDLDAIAYELWEMYELKKGIRGVTAITTYLMGDIVEAVRQLHAKHN